MCNFFLKKKVAQKFELLLQFSKNYPNKKIAQSGHPGIRPHQNMHQIEAVGTIATRTHFCFFFKC
jgi:hypothetical protein